MEVATYTVIVHEVDAHQSDVCYLKKKKSLKINKSFHTSSMRIWGCRVLCGSLALAFFFFSLFSFFRSELSPPRFKVSAPASRVYAVFQDMPPLMGAPGRSSHAD